MKTFWVLVVLSIALVLLWNSGFPPLYRASLLLVIGLVLSRLWVWGHLRRVEGSLEVSAQRVQVGQGVEVRVRLHNPSLIPKPWLVLKLESDLPQSPRSMVVALPSRSARTWRFNIPCRQRGQFCLGPLVLSSRDPFGLLQRTLTLGSRHELLVYPKTVDLAPSVVMVARSTDGEIARFGLRGSAPIIGGVRDYLPGDSFSRIHWLSSARMRRLMSKQLEQETSQDVWLLVDMEARVQAGEGEESTAEYGVTLAASLAKSLVEANRSVALAAWCRHLHVVPPGKGATQLSRVMEALSMAGQGTEPLPRLMAQTEERWRSGSTLVIVTPSVEESCFASLRTAIQRGSQVLLFWVDASTFNGKGPQPAPSWDWDRATSYSVKRGELWRLGL